MPFLLRNIKKARWKKEDKSWLNDGDSPADILTDFRSQENNLSIWCVEDDSGNLGRILAAFAAKRDYLQVLDIVLFDSEIISDLDIQTKQTNGETFDYEINKNCHFDLNELTLYKVANLARKLSDNHEILKNNTRNVEIKRDSAFIIRYTRGEVAKLIAEGLQSGNINKAELKNKKESTIIKELITSGLLLDGEN